MNPYQMITIKDHDMGATTFYREIVLFINLKPINLINYCGTESVINSDHYYGNDQQMIHLNDLFLMSRQI